MTDNDKPIYAMGFFDGQNLFQHAMDAFGHYHPNYDPIKLHGAVCASKGWTPNLVRFYTGTPSINDNEMWGHYWSNRILAMKRAGIHVVRRPLRYHKHVTEIGGIKEVVRIPREKGVDVRLALDIVSTARTRQYAVAVIYSQDQDLSEVVSELADISKEQGRKIHIACAFPDGPKASTRRGIDGTEWIRMDEEFYNACLDPKDYRSKGYKSN